MSLLEKMAQEPCESFTGPMFGGTMTCMSEGSGKSPDARYLADRYCSPCRLRAALAEERTEYGVRILWSADGLPEYRRMDSRADALAFRALRAPWSHTPVKRSVGAWQEDSERPTDEEFWEIAKIRYIDYRRSVAGPSWDRLREEDRQREFRITVSAWGYARAREEADRG